MQLSKILIGVVFMSILVAGMMYFYTGGVASYNPTDYNDTALSELAGATNDISTVVQNAETNITDIKGHVDQNDAAEVLLTGAFKTAVITGKSVPIIVKSTQTAVKEIPVANDYANSVISGLALAVLIVFIIAILMNIATKSPRT